MATEFVITAENNPQIFRDVAFKDAAITYSFDFSPWAEDNNTVSTVTWSVEAGNSAAISGQALSSNVATALVTFSDSGGSLIKIKAESSTEIYVVYLDVLAKEPKRQTNDYGLCR